MHIVPYKNWGFRQQAKHMAHLNELLAHELSSKGDCIQIELAIKEGRVSDINYPDASWDNRTPLHCAAESGDEACVKLLLSLGADPSRRTQSGWTPAHCAAAAGHLRVLELLARDGAPLTSPDNHGDKPLDVAIRYGNPSCEALLRTLRSP